MSEALRTGDTLSLKLTVDRDRTIGFMGETCRVYSTPSLLADIEMTCRDLVVTRTPEGEDSVGVTVSLTHMAPTVMGMEVTVTVTVSEIDGRKVVFDVTAADDLEQICTGRHQRFIVDVAKTAERLKAKAAKARDL